MSTAEEKAPTSIPVIHRRYFNNCDQNLGELYGIPGLSILVGFTASGLAVGLELDASEGHDRRLLGAGLAVEKCFGALPPPKVLYG